jgi:hypothetical protein
MKKHDEAKLTLADCLLKNKDDEVFVEPTLKVDGNLYKPDLVIKNEGRVPVVDLTVCYENKEYLPKVEKEEIDKYLPCLQYLKRKFNVGGGLVLPVDLGSRAAITPNTEANLKLMVVNLFIYFNSKNTLVIN